MKMVLLLGLALATMDARGQAPPTPAAFFMEHRIPFTTAGLEGALKNSDPGVRGVAAGVLAEWKSVQSIPAIESALQVERYPQIRETLARALAQLKEQESAQAATSKVAKSAGELIGKLQDSVSAPAAEVQLERLAATDAGVRDQLSRTLPGLLLQAGKPRDQLAVVARLAGTLRLVSTVPALCRLLEQPTENGLSTDIYRYIELANDPFGLALVEIGEPSVPGLSRLLRSKRQSTRSRAARALMKIGTPGAQAALKSYVGEEPDKGVKTMVESYLAARR